jgi:putative hydrolase of the HAD superfamily
LMQPYVKDVDLDAHLFATEMRNLKLFGYGVKSFSLSMIETAIELSEGRVTASEIQAIIDAGRSMLEHPVELLEGAADAVERATNDYRVMLITKGDLFDQESKLARSGLGEMFDAVEIVAEKDEMAYRHILRRQAIAPQQFVMVGNSGRSDILPTLALGGWAVHIPYPLTWAHEHIDDDTLSANERYRRIDSLEQLPGLLAEL